MVNEFSPSVERLIYLAIGRIAGTLGLRTERSEIDIGDLLELEEHTDIARVFQTAAKQLGIAVQETDMRDPQEISELVAEGYPVVGFSSESEWLLFPRTVGRKLELNTIQPDDVRVSTISKRALGRLLADEKYRWLVAKEELDCDSISSSPVHPNAHSHGGKHQKPTRRLLGLLRMDAADISTVALFALVAGILSLATPLAVESLVNVVSWGIYLQPLLVLATMLMVCLGFSAALSVLQTIVAEVIQRRQLVRIVSDLAHRFPRADRRYLEAEYPREFANRLFDIMTIQKATAVLLLDGITILITTILGLLLLAFYHPFLLGFDIVLLSCMVFFTWLLGRGGIRTAIQESVTKYRIVHWLQDVIAQPEIFRVNGGEALSIDRANRFAVEYVQARKLQFRVVLRQVIFAVGLQVVASTALLGLGGWLVIQGQLTLGQLVASELVVTVVVGAFSKAGKSLEKYYDLMAGIDKVGYLLDVETGASHEVSFPIDQALELRWEQLEISRGNETCTLPPTRVRAGSSLAIVDYRHGKMISDVLAGLIRPATGTVAAAGIDVYNLAAGCHQGQAIGYASNLEVFHGSVAENIDLGRVHVGRGRVREVLAAVGLLDEILQLPDGVDTMLQTDGFPLTPTQVARLAIARAIAARPGVIVVNGLLDLLPGDQRNSLVRMLGSEEVHSTLVIVTRSKELASQCEQIIESEH